MSRQGRLSKSQARALQKLSRASKSRFDSFIQESGISGKNKDRSDKPSPSKRGLKEFSAAEIEAIAEKEIEKQALAEQERLRETIPLVSKVKVLLMSRLGIPVEIIASNLRINWKTAQKYGQDTGLFETVRKSLGDGLSVPIVTKKHALPEPLVWSVALEGKNDQDRFDALGWKIRPWDYWYWNNCDRRFGDEWPARLA